MALTILDAMEDPRLFGREFSGESWDGWRAFLAVLFGLGLEDEALDTYRLCTGRTEAPTAPFSEAHVIVGRRGGKSLAYRRLSLSTWPASVTTPTYWLPVRLASSWYSLPIVSKAVSCSGTSRV